ncbi:cytochrome P450 [Chiua virens]|nr:cytochrome P450 [Chiua virens]
MSVSTSIFRWATAGIALVAFKVIVDKVLSVQKAFARIKDYPGRQVIWLKPFGALSLMLGTRFPIPGMVGNHTAKFSTYQKFGATSLATVWISTARQIFWTADSEAIKLITSDRHTFQKDVVTYELINIYGQNVISTEGSDWKRHRSVVMSAFNEANVALVWSEALKVMTEWFEELDAVGPDTTIDLVLPLARATLCIIVSAGFGERMSWNADTVEELPPGRKLTFRSAVLGSVENIIFRALTPGWFYQLSSLIKVPYLSERALFTRLAFDDLRSHMVDLVASARADIMSGGPAASRISLLRNLVEANMNQDGDSKRLTEGELFSNIFAFLLAGHETSAHTLCFAFVLLALYPDVQQKLYEEVSRVWPGDVPVAQVMANHKGYMDKLEYTSACIRETLRVFPVVSRIPKNVHADMVLPSTYFTPGSKENPSNETGKCAVAVPEGGVVIIDIWAMHMNPLYWGEDAAEYKPERFIDTESHQWPRDAFLPFLGGPRSCIGQRFAFAEMIGILASIVRRYRILVPDDLVKKPLEEQKEALLKWETGVTLTPLSPRVKISRRE